MRREGGDEDMGVNSVKASAVQWQRAPHIQAITLTLPIIL